MKTTLKRKIIAVALCVVGAAAPHVRAISVTLSTVGNPGNSADTTGIGSVGYTFDIGTDDVTQGQYVAFLNAVAASEPGSLGFIGLGSVPLALRRRAEWQ